ncbi:uncharacterized protein LOC130966165 [Arachis stenosperma]|uniref:uncharacterized protein LOC130966165 n=1 Tax=Arachis stenosperma TaxID=217475 RepID=UPI0025AB6E06|nr:uncharacterized protein LOC130966165 [Arachis stenosperma]
MSSKWLSKAFMKKICKNPKIKLRTLIRKAHSKWNVDLTKTKAAKVKQQALDEINGTYGEQYRKIHDYAAELLRSNPSSTVRMQVERPPEFQLETSIPGNDMRPRFERIYIFLDACKRSFMVCRTMIGLDGYFIKTPYGGQLLTAIEWDPNDQISPIAYAIVKAETKDSWTWFLLNLCDDLGVDKIRWCTFMSDQQKGLTPTFDELLPAYITGFMLGRDKYEVSSSQDNRDKFVVDLQLHESSCREFQLTGYPCEHAMSCIRKMCLDVKNYVNKCYKKETYVDYYQHVIYLVNGLNLWARTENDDVLPPVFRKPIGHPKLSRNKTSDESRNNGPLAKLSKDVQQQKCSYCFALGYNKRTCPKKHKVEALAKKHNAALQAKKSAGTTGIPNPSKNPAKITKL